jgi:predicted O-methyltransferase YrrM
MDLKFECTDDGIAYTYVNGVKGTLNQADTNVLLSHYIQIPMNGKYAETGSYLGCSGVLAGLSSKHGTTIYCHDIWVDNMEELSNESGPPPKVDDYFYTFYENVLNNNLQNIVIPIRGDSAYTLNIHKDKSIDLAFIDGDHSYEGALKDFNTLLPKMKTNGIILCHDCHQNNDVMKALMEFCKENSIENATGFKNSSIIKITLEPSSTPQCPDNTSSDPS